MPKKNPLKVQAFQLRFENRCSYKEIETQLGVPRSTMTYWFKNHPENAALITELRQKTPTAQQELQRKQKFKKTWRDRRKASQDKGKKDCNKFDLHLAGCMLYWAEGFKKTKNRVYFCNTDIHMLKLWIRFLQECYDVPMNKIKWEIGKTITHAANEEECKLYWGAELNLDPNTYSGCRIDKRRRKSPVVRDSCPYGICRIVVDDTALLQRIFGAIKQYAGINDPDLWLDG